MSMRPTDARFQSTHWTLIQRLGADSEASRSALEELCGAYWYPLYAWLRRSGRDREDARDLVQGFFLRLLSRRDLERLREGGGRFRSWLLRSLENFAANADEARRALKRGGGRTIMPLELDRAEERYAQEPADPRFDATRLYERRWALTVLERALELLRVEQDEKGRSALFARLEPTLTGSLPAGEYERIGGELGLETNAVKVAAHRLRERFGELLRREVAATLDGPQGVDDEVGALLAALGE